MSISVSEVQEWIESQTIPHQVRVRLEVPMPCSCHQEFIDERHVDLEGFIRFYVKLHYHKLAYYLTNVTYYASEQLVYAQVHLKPCAHNSWM
jgi:hypothetical protein